MKKQHALRAAILGTAISVAGAAYLHTQPNHESRMASQEQTGLTDAALTTGSIYPEEEMPTDQAEADILANALTALDERRLGEAQATLEAMATGSLDHDILTHAMALSGNRGVSAGFIRGALERLEDWPRQDVLRDNLERAVSRSWFPAHRLRELIDGSEPRTIEGAIVLAEAERKADNQAGARDLLIKFWHQEVLPTGAELAILEQFSDTLTLEDHQRRYFNMMARDRIRAATRIVQAAEMQAVHSAWAAVIRRAKNASNLIADLSEEQLESESGYLLRIKHFRQKQDYTKARELLAEFAEEHPQATNPDALWTERRIVSRSLRERGDLQAAYEIAAAHKGGNAVTQTEAAFHAGWYALRGLDNAEAALAHFSAIEPIAKGGATKARGAYWMGRAATKLGDEETAERHFERAAKHPTTYHGQLALHSLKREMPAMDPPEFDVGDAATVERNRIYRAARRLQKIGQERRAERFLIDFGAQLDNASLISALSTKLAATDDHFPALKIGKGAAWSGLPVGALSHPTGALPEINELSQDAKLSALVHAVARQESEFNSKAVSSAEARGLLQLLPSTARQLARANGIEFQPSFLTEDPRLNVRLGALYLEEQLSRFGNSYVLTLIAYNAGPGRAREWIKRFGDPSGLPLYEMIDWVEQIPFPETKSYVQKVMENLQVYKSRFGEGADIAKDLRFGASS